MDVADMTGRTVIVTGGNSGIGTETALSLVRAGARTVITARDGGRGEAAVADIKSRSGSDQLEMAIFDLGDLASVRKGAAELLDRFDRIDVLVNNAGIILSERRVTVDGLEATLAVNHLGPFLLTELLLERITQSPGGRIVNVASTAHSAARGGITFDDLQSESDYRAMRVYGMTKLANIYFTTELARRTAGTGVTANCLHPGTVGTGYGRDGDTSGILALGLKLAKPFMLSPEKGARTSVYLASSPEVAAVSGKYFIKSKPRLPSKAAQDEDAARRLWDVSERLVS
jgi:NAD(P)-dependent dehydrogenase (short-subunit alcohol dehydrogenase family)